MSTAIALAPDTTPATVTSPDTSKGLYAFTRDFFVAFGADVEEKDGLLHVQLSDRMALWFGRRKLVLRFPGDDRADDEAELVAYGTRTFEHMLSFLRRTGQYTELRLPQRYTPHADIIQAADLRGVRARLTPIRSQEAYDRAFRFNFKIAYLSDERVEELHSVVIDATGRNRPDLLDAATEGIPRSARYADAQTGITRCWKAAVNYVKLHADQRGMEVEKEILPRLHGAASRLIAFYNDQESDVPQNAADRDEQIAALRAECKRKLDDEAARHSLRIEIDLVSHALVRIPVQEYFLTIDRKGVKSNVYVRHELHSNNVVLPLCQTCRKAIAGLALCHNGCVVCQECIHVCSVCGAEECTTCGAATCALCGNSLCHSCGAVCPSCHRTVCRDHLQTCQVCGDTVCSECVLTCPECGRVECKMHGGVCSVCEREVCSQCLGTCANGHPACRQHLAVSSSDGKEYCHRCLTTCHACGDDGPKVATAHAQTCHIGKETICQEHMRLCAVCFLKVCPTHSFICEVCGKTVCTNHRHRNTSTCTACSWKQNG